MRADRLFTSIFPVLSLVAISLLLVGAISAADVAACERTHSRSACLKMVGG